MTRRPTPADAAHGWLSRDAAAELYSVHPRTLRKWRDAGLLESQIAADGRTLYRAAVSPSTPSAPRLSGDSQRPHRHPTTPADSSSGKSDGGAVEDAPDALRHGPGDGWIEREGYVYDGTRDTYVIQAPSQGRPLVWPGDRVRQLWRAYTDGATVAEITRRFALSRALWGEIKTALRLTHTRAPWTDEEIEATDEDALVLDGLRAKERAVMARVERGEWRRIKEDAARWRTLRASVLDHLTGWTPEGITLPTPPPVEGGRWLLFGASDLHVGKRTHGDSGDLRGQVRDLAGWLGRGVTRAARQQVKGIVVPIGSDLLHSDTLGQTTTRGTPQGAQAVGSIYQQVQAATDLMAGLVDELARIAPVRAVWVAGNHDEVLSYCVALALEQRYRSVAHVTVDTAERRRKVVACGEVPLLLLHGDKIRDRDLPGIVSREVPRSLDPRRTVIARGHVHHAALAHDEIAGYDVITLTTPAHADDWHHASGYDLSQRRLTLAWLGAHGLDALEWVR